jgi:hypothetical protein
MPAGAETKILTVGMFGNFQYRTISAAVAAATPTAMRRTIMISWSRPELTPTIFW